jgi:hypothetical protein
MHVLRRPVASAARKRTFAREQAKPPERPAECPAICRYPACQDGSDPPAPVAPPASRKQQMELHLFITQQIIWMMGAVIWTAQLINRNLAQTVVRPAEATPIATLSSFFSLPSFAAYAIARGIEADTVFAKRECVW